MRNKSRKFYLGILALLIAVAVFYLVMQNGKTSAVVFREDKVEIGSIHINVLATGTVQPENRLEIKPPISGRVEKVLIEEGQKVRKGQVLAWMSSTERAALLDGAREKGVREIKKWEEIYPPTPILAPLDGTIILQNVQQGETFTNTESLMAMSDHLIVKAQVDETDIASITLNQNAQIILDAYPDQKIPATVSKIAFEATTVNNVTTYIIDILPKEIPDFMRSGMTANVNFVIDSRENILLIPMEAITEKDGRSLVLLLVNGKQLEREVTTGINNGKQIEIISGLSEGDVVLSPQIQLSEKDKGTTSPFSPMRGGGSGSRR